MALPWGIWWPLTIGVIGINVPDPYQAVLLNLCTDLGSVVLLFFVINRYFFIDEWNISIQLKKYIEQLELGRNPSALEFFKKSPNITHYLLNAIDIKVCGISATAIINEQFGVLRERFVKGAKIRVMIIDPDSTAIEMASLRSEARDSDYYQRRLQTVLKDIEYLKQIQIENDLHTSNTSAPGELAVRLLQYPPCFGIIAVDTHQPSGRLFIEIYPHKTSTKPPNFELTAERDGEWYYFFLNQFDRMWQHAKPWRP